MSVSREYVVMPEKLEVLKDSEIIPKLTCQPDFCAQMSIFTHTNMNRELQYVFVGLIKMLSLMLKGISSEIDAIIYHIPHTHRF